MTLALDRITTINIMKKFIPLIIIPLIICPAVCFSSYLIELNNGSKFIAYHYWKKDNLIKFYYYGGLVGIPKDSIFKISESEKEFREEIDSKKTATEFKKKDKKINFDDYKNKKISLVKRLKNQQKKLEQNISRGKAEMWIERRKRKIKDIMSEIDSLAKELMEKNNEILPDWWHDISVLPPNDSS